MGTGFGFTPAALVLVAVFMVGSAIADDVPAPSADAPPRDYSYTPEPVPPVGKPPVGTTATITRPCTKYSGWPGRPEVIFGNSTFEWEYSYRTRGGDEGKKHDDEEQDSEPRWHLIHEEHIAYEETPSNPVLCGD